MIVIDVGCFTFSPREDSVQRLIDRFDPRILFGYDPLGEDTITSRGNTMLVLRRAAAYWKAALTVGVVVDGNRTSITPNGVTERYVPAVNLPALIQALPRPLVLKLDCEGCEFPLLHRIRALNLDRTLDLVLVEWHEATDPAADCYGYGWQRLGRPDLRCEVENWL